MRDMSGKVRFSASLPYCRMTISTHREKRGNMREKALSFRFQGIYSCAMARPVMQKTQNTVTNSLTRVVMKGERVVVHRRGKAVAALIPLEDLALLEELEDRLDVEEAERRLADPSDKSIPYEQVRRELGLASM
jgi:PHD/YefM family antitoxin component YafN of YafNO toxin-antitoxin module